MLHAILVVSLLVHLDWMVGLYPQQVGTCQNNEMEHKKVGVVYGIQLQEKMVLGCDFSLFFAK